METYKRETKHQILKDCPNTNGTFYEKEIINNWPHMKEILEDIFKTSPDYAIYNIWEQASRITFYMNQSMGAYIGLNKVADLLNKYGVSFQVPGNQPYTFSISISKEIKYNPKS